jgi:hypothetical protein
MIRFINLGKQLWVDDEEECPDDFAFFDTVRDEFKTFSGFQVWNRLTDFIVDFKSDNNKEDIWRYFNLMPDNIKVGLKDENEVRGNEQIDFIIKEYLNKKEQDE